MVGRKPRPTAVIPAPVIHPPVTPADGIRVFWAIDLPGEIKTRLDQIQSRLRQRMPGASSTEASWTDPAGMHLTLAFLGRVPRTELPRILSAGAALAPTHPPFAMDTAGLGCFPEAGRAKVLWMGFHPCPSAKALAESLQRAMAALGVPVDEKPFIPHLTLARLKPPAALTSVLTSGLTMDPPGFAARLEVREMTLFESRPGPHGSMYTPLEGFRLG